MAKLVLQVPWSEMVTMAVPPKFEAITIEETTPSIADTKGSYKAEIWRIAYRAYAQPKWGMKVQYGGRLQLPREPVIYDPKDITLFAHLMPEERVALPSTIDSAIRYAVARLGLHSHTTVTEPQGYVVRGVTNHGSDNEIVIDRKGISLLTRSIGYRYWGNGAQDDVIEPDESQTLWSPEAPIGWRAWNVRRGPRGSFILEGMRVRWSHRTLEAVCEEHEYRHGPTIPDWGCGCGVYAVKDMNGLQWGDIYGQVALWGRVIEHEDGWRAQKATIVYLNRNHRLGSAAWIDICTQYRLNEKTGVTLDEDWQT